ncbi:MAG: phosphoglucosamine mutase [Candidatus Hadarchaeales archaeon]
MPRLFGTFGVRGLANVELTPELVYRLGLALATHLGNQGEVAVGRDNRTSSEMLEQAVIAGLTSGGCRVLKLGMVPTPVFSFGVKHFRCSAGVMITASHNPPEYNGVKFWEADGSGFSREREGEIERLLEEGRLKKVGWREIGGVEEADALEPYREEVLRRVKAPERGLKVVVDCGNAVGSLVVPGLLSDLGVQVISLNDYLDGTYPSRKLEPLPENLTLLSRTVASCGADLGIALDGDADRSVVADETGRVLMGDRVFALVARHYLRGRRRPRIITPVATSSVIDDVARELGGEVVRTRVGEPEIVGEFKRNGGDLGGEENGGVMFFDWSMCREGIFTSLKFVEALAESGRKASEFDATLPLYFQVKERVPCPNELKGRVMEELVREFSSHPLDRTDGLKIQTEDGWLLLRPSGTEPIFRCFAEARTEERARELAELGLRKLREVTGKMAV